MKKILLLLVVAASFSTACFAQTTDTVPKKEMTKEEKAVAKAKKEAEQEAMFSQLAFTEEEKTKFKEIIATASAESKVLKEKTGLSADEMETAKKAINDKKNKALKELLGEERYKQYNAIKKKQKEEAAAATPTPSAQ